MRTSNRGGRRWSVHPPHRVRKPAVGRGDRAPAGRHRHREPDRPRAGRVRRAGQRGDDPRADKSQAGLRTVSIPASIVPDLEAHLEKYVRPDAEALVFTGVKGGPMRRSGFNKITRWPFVVKALGVPNLHFHDLRHTGNTLAADMGVSLRNLMARMGHDNERAALRYQHRSANADRAIADGLDALMRARDESDDDDDGTAGVPVPVG
nr:tyrosine-type recombinase/integrase [Actinomadura sp. WMMB 499]